MALFGKDRERGDRARNFGVESVAAGISAPGEAETMFERDKLQTQMPQTPVTPPRVEEAGNTTSAFLGKGTRVTGKLVFEGAARIEGQVDGEITAQDTLTIGESALVNAQIIGNAVVVHGRVTGDVTARKRLEIRAPGRLVGNINTPSLIIHEGVVFEGHCTMGGAEGSRADKDRKVAHFPQEQQRPTEPPTPALAK